MTVPHPAIRRIARHRTAGVPPAQGPATPHVAQVQPDAAAALAGWQRFFSAGRELLDGMAHALLPAGAEGAKIERDPQTGQAYVKLPLPSPDALVALETALSVLRGGTKGPPA